MPRRGKRRAAAVEPAGSPNLEASAPGPSEQTAGLANPRKRRKRAASSLPSLSSEDQDRLGRNCSSSDFLIKLAQGRGSSVCIFVRAMKSLLWEDGLVKAQLTTFDEQELTAVFRGQWINAFGTCFSSAKPASIRQTLILSGHGGAISASGSSIIYESGAVIIKAFSDHDHEKADNSAKIDREWIEVVKGVMRSGHEASEPAAPVAAETPIRSRVLERIIEETPQAQGSALAAPALAGAVRTPGWLDTPAPVFPPAAQGNAWFPMTTVSPTNARMLSMQAQDRQVSLATSVASRPGSAENGLEPRTKKRDKAHFIKEIRDVAGRPYIPLSEIPTQVCKHNVIGVMIADSSPRRASGGDQDWHIRIVLRDLHNLKVKGSTCVTFNIFAKTEDALPLCPDGSIVGLVGVNFKPFNGKPQGIGRVGNVQWYLLSSQEADSSTVKVSGAFHISDEERKIIRGQHRIYREDFMNLGLESGPVGRRLLKLSDVEADNFFDTHVEIVKIWDRSHPPTIYVTDYTSNPHVHIAQDAHLQVLSREEIHQRQLETGDDGNGHVFAVSLWNAQIDAVPQLEVGMYVRLTNIRPKRSMTGHLEGSIGGAYNGAEKLCIMVLADEDATPIKRAKEAYVAKALATRENVVVPSRASSEAAPALPAPAPERTQSDTSSSLNRTKEPPAGQAILQTTQDRVSRDDNDLERPCKTPSNIVQLSQERLVYTQVNEAVSGLPYTHLADLSHLAAATSDVPSPRDRVFHCRVRIIDIKPKYLREFVRIRCGLCQNTLPPSESMCKECADMDGKDLRHEYLFALLVCDASDTAPATSHGHSRPTNALPLTVKGAEANQFLHHFHPRDVRERETTRARLRNRLGPLFGAKLDAQCEAGTRQTPSLPGDVSTSSSSHAPSGSAFDVGIVVREGANSGATGQKRPALAFHLVHTRLIKAEAVPSKGASLSNDLAQSTR